MNIKLLEEVQEQVEADETQQELFYAYHDMDRVFWEAPAGWTARPEMRIRVSTEAHDALKTMANFFDTYKPKWDISPLSEDSAEDAERQEVWLEYFVKKANQNGESYPLHEGLFNAGKYKRTIYHCDYLPYWLPKNKSTWTNEQKENAKNGPFCITAIDPRGFYYRFGKYGLRWVAPVSNLTAQDIIDKWEPYENDRKVGKQIKAGLAKLKESFKDDKGNVRDEDYFIYVDFTNYEDRFVIAIPTTSETIADFSDMDLTSESYITILDGKNELGFIPYAVASGNGDALLYSMHVGGSWVNHNIIESVVDTSILKRAFIPPVTHQSQTGKPMDIAFDGTMDSIELAAGESATINNLPPIDPGLVQLMGINGQRMSKALGISNLGMQDIAGNVQFSTISKQIELQLTNLQPYQRIAEKANIQLAYIMFKWIDYTGDSLVAYRPASRTKQDGQFKGQPVKLGEGDFDPYAMQIECKLLSAAPTDKQQQVNMATTLIQAGATLPFEEVMEDLGYTNPAASKNKWIEEQLEKLALKNFDAQQTMRLQLEQQAATIQMQTEAAMAQQQQAAQQAQAQTQQEQGGPNGQTQEQVAASGGNPAQGDPLMQGGAMNDPNQGGQPPVMNAPDLAAQ